MMDVDQWLAILCSMDTNAKPLKIILSGIEEDCKEYLQVMLAEFLVRQILSRLVKSSFSVILINKLMEVRPFSMFMWMICAHI